jgi:hypothetical protein
LGQAISAERRYELAEMLERRVAFEGVVRVGSGQNFYEKFGEWRGTQTVDAGCQQVHAGFGDTWGHSGISFWVIPRDLPFSLRSAYCRQACCACKINPIAPCDKFARGFL